MLVIARKASTTGTRLKSPSRQSNTSCQIAVYFLRLLITLLCITVIFFSREAGSVKREITHRSISETLEIKQGEAAFIHFLTFLFFFKLIADTVDAFHIVWQVRSDL